MSNLGFILYVLRLSPHIRNWPIAFYPEYFDAYTFNSASLRLLYLASTGIDDMTSCYGTDFV